MSATNAQPSGVPAPEQVSPPEPSLRADLAAAPGRLAAEAERLKAEAARLKAESQRLKKASEAHSVSARALAPLVKPATWADPRKLGPAVTRAEQRVAAAGVRIEALESLLPRLKDHVAHAAERGRRELGRALKEACAAAGLDFDVVTKEAPVEVRIPPFSVILDFDKGRAELRFARENLATCPATAEEILEARARAVRSLDGPFEAEAWFRQARSAYRLALADRGRPDGERVEILDFLPFLALLRQSKRFRVNPIKENFRPYPKAQFAWDVLRLGKSGGFARGGLRLNLGVATGTTASDRSRVVFFENERGQGEYKLTVFFTRIEGGEPA